MRNVKVALLPVLSIFFLYPAYAQQKSANANDSLAVQVQKISKTLQALEKIKISGYIQAQYQKADTAGIKTFNGGDFPSVSSQRFMVRRGYLKIAYTGKLSTYVLQFNVNEKGFGVRDAYLTVKEPWWNTLSLTAGLFFRPFGYELSYATNKRESPELSRVVQSLFPGERDLGASLTFQLPEKSKLHPLKIEAGLFNGNGTASETDDKLDFIGRIGYSVNDNKTINWGAGVSYYNGSVFLPQSLKAFEMDVFDGTPAFGQMNLDSLKGNYFERRYLGFDGQLAIKSGIGVTTLRADYIVGKQPGTAKSSISPTALLESPVYIRNFSGAVIYLIHTIPNTKHSVVFKFDYLDPNTDTDADRIGLKSAAYTATGNTDLAYRTFGFGYFNDLNPNLRLTLYYEVTKNETSSNLKGYTKDLKDNLLTIRAQYKF